jgi:hypothetical protein
MELTFTPQAITTLNKMRNTIAEIGAHYGMNSVEYLNANSTFAHCITSLITLGGDISADGELSLFGYSKLANSEHGFSYGMVWHSRKAPEEYRNFPNYGTWSINS